MFCEVDCEIKQNDAREGKNMQISAKINQKYAKKKQALFWATKHLFCIKKTVKIDVSTYENVQHVGVSGSILSGFWVFLSNLVKV